MTSATNRLVRIQIAMWLPAACAMCGREYVSVDDFLGRDPRTGKGFAKGQWGDAFVDDACWPAYVATRPHLDEAGVCCPPHADAHEHGPCCRDEPAEGGGE